jgi:hypothetical protein
METKTFKTIDRAALGWPSGEWDSEPDKMQWPDEATGLPCLAVRHPRSGNWCGYVGVAEGHPLFGKDYDDADLEVHGGITFAEACRPGSDESTGICHTPAPGEPDHVWWLGFDCAHAWDHSPDDVRRSAEGYPWNLLSDSHYRTLAYVQNECRSLAQQLAQGSAAGAVSEGQAMPDGTTSKPAG